MKTDQFLISRNTQAQRQDGQRLVLFKSLLQPHFLFNSLNNLYALSLRESDQTPDAIAGLSRMLERVVGFSRREMISLAEEVDLIRDYISLEKIWLGELAFMLDFQVKGDVNSVSIPPLAIYTLIENAFKHGIRKCQKPGWITIQVVVKQDKVLLKIRNSIESSYEETAENSILGTGLGIEAVNSLLEDCFHKSYFLDARSLGDVYAVDLIIGRGAA